MSGLRERHPEETELQLKLRFAEMFYGAGAAQRIAESRKSCRSMNEDTTVRADSHSWRGPQTTSLP